MTVNQFIKLYLTDQYQMQLITLMFHSILIKALQVINRKITSTKMTQKPSETNSEGTIKIYHQKSTCNILLMIILMSVQIMIVSGTCAYNANCDVKCKDKVCQYDPSTNFYYNSSVTTPTGYQGQGCCNGCGDDYSSDYYYDSSTKNCIRGSCTADANGTLRYWYYNNTCLYVCPAWRYTNSFSGACELNCSNGYYQLNTTRECVPDCPSGAYKVTTNGYYYCTYYCANNYQYSNNDTGFCQSNCTTGYADDSTNECLHNCPPGKYKQESQKKCVTKQYCSTLYQYVNNVSGFCQKNCTNGLYSDTNTHECVMTCSQGYYKYFFPQVTYFYSGNSCVQKGYCNNISAFANNVTQSCQKLCSNNLYGEPQSGYCVQNCSNNYFKYPVNKTCISNCFKNGTNRFFNNETNLCQTACPDGQYGNTVSGYCVSVCDNNMYLLQSKKYCVQNCTSFSSNSSTPYSIYRDSLSRKCVGIGQCPYDSVQMVQRYGQNSTGNCEQECADRTYGHPQLKICVNSCTGQYPYKNRILKVCSSTNDQSLYQYLNKGSMSTNDKYYVVSQVTVIIIGVIAIGVVLIVIGGVLFYKYYFRKRFVRQAWKFTGENDISFNN